MIFFALLLVDPLLLGSITGGGIAPPYVPNLPNEKRKHSKHQQYDIHGAGYV